MAFAQAVEQADTGAIKLPSASEANEGGIVTEIIVTARKRSERLNEIPATIEVFSASDLAPAGISLSTICRPSFRISSSLHRAQRVSP